MSLLPANVNVGVVLDCVLFPISFKELLDTIEKNGYVLNPALPVVRPLGRFRGSGQIGTKGKNAFQVDAGDKSLIVLGVSLDEVKTEFESVSKTLFEDYSIDLDVITKFYQYSGNYKYKTEHNPYDIISKTYESPHQEEVSKLFGEPMKTFAIRLATSLSLPENVNWFDVKITPDIQRNDGYLIETVYRNENKEIYEAFLDNFESNITSVLKHLEE